MSLQEYKSAREPEAKLNLAQVICMELTLQAMVEEEIFYPAYVQATGDEKLLEHALKEHQGIKDLVARVPTAENVDAVVEAIKQHTLYHVEEERRGMFAKARACGMELATLGGRIQTRRAEVMDVIQAA